MKRIRKFILVIPFDPNIVRVFFKKIMSNPVPLVVVATLPKDIEVEIFDENSCGRFIDWLKDFLFQFLWGKRCFNQLTKKRFKQLIKGYSYKEILFGITAVTPVADRAFQIISLIKKWSQEEVPIIMGGDHATHLPEECLQKGANTVVVKEVEGLWPEIISDLENTQLKPIYQRPTPLDMAEIPPLAKYFGKIEKYLQLIRKHYYIFPFIECSRGCPYKCEFCTVTQKHGQVIRWRPISDIIADLQLLVKKFGLSFLFFPDNNICALREKALEFFKALIVNNLKIGWAGQSWIKVADDLELLKLLKESGCQTLLIGLESLNQERLIKEIGKKDNIDQYPKQIGTIHQMGLETIDCFVFNEIEDPKEIIKFIQNSTLIPQISLNTPMPGSGLWDKLLAQKRILKKPWSCFNVVNICYQPKGMTAKELQKRFRKLCKRVYSWREIFRRTWRAYRLPNHSFPRTISVFLTNLVYRRISKVTY